MLALSIVIPTLDEARTLAGLLDDLATLRVRHEVIVVDGGSTDATIAVAERGNARLVRTRRGRGTQLRAGAAAATGATLCFVHADVRLPVAARDALESLATGGRAGAWAFRLRIDGRRWAYRLVEWGANARSSLLALPYGDQGLVIPRALYERVGGYADVPLMEDVLLARALRAVGGVQLLRAAVVVSARRWERDGVLRRSIRNLWLLVRFLTGDSPSRLASAYEAEPTTSGGHHHSSAPRSRR